MNRHICTHDDRGLCESCETLKRDEGARTRRWAEDILELSRVMMVERIKEKMRMEREEMVDA